VPPDGGIVVIQQPRFQTLEQRVRLIWCGVGQKFQRHQFGVGDDQAVLGISGVSISFFRDRLRQDSDCFAALPRLNKAARLGLKRKRREVGVGCLLDNARIGGSRASEVGGFQLFERWPDRELVSLPLLAEQQPDK